MERRLAGSLRARWKQLATTAKDWECRALCASAKASEVYRDHFAETKHGKHEYTNSAFQRQRTAGLSDVRALKQLGLRALKSIEAEARKLEPHCPHTPNLNFAESQD